MLPHWYYYLEQLGSLCFIRYSVCDGGDPVVQLIPVSPFFRLAPVELPLVGSYALSRFAYVRRTGRVLALESPLSLSRVEINDSRSGAIIMQLCEMRTVGDLEKANPDMDASCIRSLLWLLHCAGMLTEASGEGRTSEDDDVSLEHWDFSDLLFHSRSRSGRHDNPVGPTYRFQDEYPALPAVKSPMSQDFIELSPINLEPLKSADVPFTRVFEERRSVRDYGMLPMTADQLSEFLFRVARITDAESNDGVRVPYEISQRPYPSGGACYALELYLLVNRCQGIPRGCYHYGPDHHRLEVLPDQNQYIDQLLARARAAMGGKTTPDVLVILAARFRRVSWKYQSVSYSLILKEVGVLFQSMYLVATAMKLAPCALGGGDSELFGRAIGTEFHDETSVGEFALGSQPDELQPCSVAL